MKWIWDSNFMDIRIVTKEITACEACPNFRDDPYSTGNARYSCGHSDGPSGKLGSDIVKNMEIHKDCPLPKAKSD